MPLHVSSTVVLITGGLKLYYTTSGIVTPVGGRPLHRYNKTCKIKQLIPTYVNIREVLYQPVDRTATYRCDDTRCCIIQF